MIECALNFWHDNEHRCPVTACKRRYHAAVAWDDDERHYFRERVSLQMDSARNITCKPGSRSGAVSVNSLRIIETFARSHDVAQAGMATRRLIVTPCRIIVVPPQLDEYAFALYFISWATIFISTVTIDPISELNASFLLALTFLGRIESSASTQNT